MMGNLYLMIAFVLAGSSVIAARLVSAYLPPFTTTFLSLVIASLAALLLCAGRMLACARAMSRRSWRVILLQALFGSFLFRVFLTFGLRLIGAAQAGIITGAAPAVTAVLTWLLLRERLSAAAVLGVALTLAGILLVQGFPFALEGGAFPLLGAALVFCAAVCEALFTVLSRKIHVDAGEEPPLSPLVQAGLVSVFAALFSLLPTLAERPWAQLRALPASGWLGLVWYGVVVTVVAFACMFAGAKRCSGYTIAAFAGLIPISSTALAALVLREPVRGYQLAGCVLVAAATVVISYPGRNQHSDESEEETA